MRFYFTISSFYKIKIFSSFNLNSEDITINNKEDLEKFLLDVKYKLKLAKEKGKKIQKKVFKENSPALTLRGKIELKRRKPLK